MASLRLACVVAACLLAVASAARLESKKLEVSPSSGHGGRGYDPKQGPLITTDLDSIQYKKGLPMDPEQLSVTYWDKNTYLISWVTGLSQVGVGLTPPDASLVKSTVQISTDKDMKTYDEFEGTALSYHYNYSGYEGYNLLDYVSGVIHHTVIPNLKPGTEYYYRVGDDRYSLSPITSFKTVANKFPIKIAAMADTGQTYNTSSTVKHILAQKVDMLINSGDLSYADNFDSRGTMACWLADYFHSLGGEPYSNVDGVALAAACQRVIPPELQESPDTYQPKFDSWARLWEPVFAHTPIIQASGNHEMDIQADGTMYEGYNARYPAPQDPTVVNTNPVSYFSDKSDNNLYSASVIPGVAKVIMLSSMVPHATFGSITDKQYTWLTNQLKSVDRKETPWVIVGYHFPMYTSEPGSFKGNECFRQAYEPLFYKYGVDIVINGHVHDYERTYPVYNYKRDPCGAVHILVGSGGNNEGVSAVAGNPPQTAWIDTIADQQPWCSNPLSRQFPDYQPQRCFSYQDEYPAKYNHYCPDKVSSWAAYRAAQWGAGVLTLESETVAKWEWHDNLDDNYRVADSVTITRSSDSCSRDRK